MGVRELVSIFSLVGEFTILKVRPKLAGFKNWTFLRTRPGLFERGIIPEIQSGESYYPREYDWLGTCLSSFGICYNLDSLDRLDLPAPTTWDDLGRPGFQKGIASG